MSHIVTIQTQVRDPVAITAACKRLGLAEPVCRKVDFYAGEAEGLAVELPGWDYPVVCQTESAELRYDNYGGEWGKQEELDRFLQAYAVEKTKLEARKQGRCVYEQTLADGSVKLTIQVEGEA